MSRAQFLADMMENTRQFSLWYMKKVPIERWKEVVNVDGVVLNHPYWTLGHLAWTDVFMVLKPLKSDYISPLFVNQFGINTKPESENELSIDDLKELVNEIHQTKIGLVKSLSDEALDGPFPLTMLKFASTYHALMHNIRHEGIHAGQISVFCKVKQIQTVKF